MAAISKSLAQIGKKRRRLTGSAAQSSAQSTMLNALAVAVLTSMRKGKWVRVTAIASAL
jgi:hypothetical protein